MKSESFEGAPGMKPNNLRQQTYPMGSAMDTQPNSSQGDATKSMRPLGAIRSSVLSSNEHHVSVEILELLPSF